MKLKSQLNVRFYRNFQIIRMILFCSHIYDIYQYILEFFGIIMNFWPFGYSLEFTTNKYFQSKDHSSQVFVSLTTGFM